MRLALLVLAVAFPSLVFPRSVPPVWRHAGFSPHLPVGFRVSRLVSQADDVLTFAEKEMIGKNGDQMSRSGTVRRLGVIGALVCGFSSTVGADPILLYTTRVADGLARTLVGLEAGSDRVSAETGDPGLFDVARTTTVTDGGAVASVDVAQNTTISPNRWFGSGSAAAFASFDDAAFGFSSADADSVMAIGFRLAEPMFYRFAATLSGNRESGGSTQVIFGGPDLSWILESSGPAVPLARSGLLSPGDYSFTATASLRALALPNTSTGPHRAAFNLQFDLSDQAPVPEPATLLLFGTGAAFVGRAAWRRRRGQAATGSSDPTADA
jgi:hypothetical protein